MSTDIIKAIKEDSHINSWLIHDCTEFEGVKKYLEDVKNNGTGINEGVGVYFETVKEKLSRALNVSSDSIMLYNMAFAEEGDIYCMAEHMSNIRNNETDKMSTLILYGFNNVKDETINLLGSYIQRITFNSMRPTRVILWVTKSQDDVKVENKLVKYLDESYITLCGETY